MHWRSLLQGAQYSIINHDWNLDQVEEYVAHKPLSHVIFTDYLIHNLAQGFAVQKVSEKAVSTSWSHIPFKWPWKVKVKVIHILKSYIL